MMNQNRWITKLLLVGVSLSLMSSCGVSRPASPTEIAKATQDLQQSTITKIEKVLKTPPSDSTAATNAAEQDVMSLLREQGGARAALGDRASVLFQQMDAAEIEAVAKIISKIQALSDQPGGGGLARSLPAARMVSLAKNPAYGAEPSDQPMEVTGLLTIVLQLFAGAKGTANLQGEMPPMEMNDTTKDNVTERLVLRLAFKGPKMEAEIDITRSHPGPPAYQESTTGKVTVLLCPDAQGNVPVSIDIKSSSSVGGGGSQWSSAMQVMGHVNDEGRLANFDMESQSSSGIQTPDGKTNQYVEMNMGYTVGWDEPGSSNAHVEFPRNSAHVTPEFVKAATDSFIEMISAIEIATMRSAEAQWTNGYCLEIQVTDMKGGKKTVQPNSETPFTATVRHKFENTDLTVPVIVGLAEGKVSVRPAGTKIPAPAAFAYTAPDETGAKATVQLETRSKRGIAKLEVAFITQIASYELEFDSIFVTNTFTPAGNSGPINVTQHVHAVVPLDWLEQDQVYRGEAPLEYVLFDVPPIFGIGGDSGMITWCPNTTSATGGTFQVLMLKISKGTTASQPGQPAAAAVELTIDPGKTIESTVPVCPAPFTFTLPPDFSFHLLTWTEEFASTHYMESQARDGKYIIKDWTGGSGNVVAVKTYTVNNSATTVLTVRENTTITLRQK